MKLSTRFWLSGAALPTLVMAIVLGGADRMFHVALERSLDQALLSQAAVESVSLFDGPTRKPHLHMATSPLLESVRPFAPEGTLFGPGGLEVMRHPERPGAKEQLHERVGPVGTPPLLSTREHDGARARVLTVAVASPSGERYTLRLRADLSQSDAAVATFHALAVAALIAAALALVLVQGIQARGLRRRLAALSDHVEALRMGDLSRALPPETASDELAALRSVLSQATGALRDAQAAKERLVADAAHELRTPLTLMRTELDLALRKERSVDELKGALRETRMEVDRLALLASRLLDAASLSRAAEARTPCDVEQLARDAVSACNAAVRARELVLKVQIDAVGERLVHAAALRQAIDNLLSNALKYARHEVVLSVHAPDARQLQIRVRDDGPGIPSAERELVFEPFHRTRGSAPGAGLGLAIVREVARAHGGDARVEPSEQGACVVLEIAAEAGA